MKLAISGLLLSLTAMLAFADVKEGQFTGVKPCTGTAGDVKVDATSKKTIGLATCKGELQKAFADKGVCTGKKKNEKVFFKFQFGKDTDKNKATGEHYVLCKG